MSKLKYGSRVKVARVPSKKGGVRIYPWEEWMDPIVGVEGTVVELTTPTYVMVQFDIKVLNDLDSLYIPRKALDIIEQKESKC